MSNETTDVSGEIVRITGQAILINDGDRDVWLPISQIENFDESWKVKDTVDLEIPEWLAIEKELV
ncbi:hypothetical protein KAR91_37055 [Candidatus Pacearchaeota archaeon]|nr:hypothetical protein [Candidatus Pacearchaeota archaeon]